MQKNSNNLWEDMMADALAWFYDKNCIDIFSLVKHGFEI